MVTNGYSYGYGYGSSGYDYGYVSPPLRYYDYANDDESAVRNVLAEYEVSWNGHDTAALGRLFTEDCDYVNIDGVHWKGVQEIVQRHSGTVSEEIKDCRSEAYRCRSSFFNARCCTCRCYLGRHWFESSHWKGRSSSERNHHDGDGQN